MVDAGIGRLLIASLHQGIADVAPNRLPFYESWLTPPGLRDGKLGLAPLHAVLSFLRLEGQIAYEQIMRRAGIYTADWAFVELSSFHRVLVRSLPLGARTRAALLLSRRMMKRTFRGSGARTRLRKGAGTIDLRGSVFCVVRETTNGPMCVFYSAAVERFLRRFDLDATVDVVECRAAGGAACTMTLTVHMSSAEGVEGNNFRSRENLASDGEQAEDVEGVFEGSQGVEETALNR
jgi:bacteriochlorophyll 4-vinyl reductase